MGRPRETWRRFAARLAAAVAPLPAGGSLLDPRRLALARSRFFGSSLNFEMLLRSEYPHLLVAERDIVPLVGRPLWTPADERPAPPPPPGFVGPPRPCPACGGRIASGERRYCPKCGASGFERRIAAQRALAGLPPPPPHDGYGGEDGTEDTDGEQGS